MIVLPHHLEDSQALFLGGFLAQWPQATTKSSDKPPWPSWCVCWLSTWPWRSMEGRKGSSKPPISEIWKTGPSVFFLCFPHHFHGSKGNLKGIHHYHTPAELVWLNLLVATWTNGFVWKWRRPLNGYMGVSWSRVRQSSSISRWDFP